MRDIVKTGHGPGLPPSPWLLRFAGLVPAGGAVLDMAAGGGRHARFFLDRGHPVVAVDRDVSGLADLAGRPGVEIVQADLETGGPWPLGARGFAGVAVANYLWRPILPAIVAAVAPGGALIYETFALGNERFGRPSNPDFLLRPGELLDAVRGRLRVVAYEDVEIGEPRPALVQRIAALAPAAG
ncbi:MAG: class I SAM-dependent methyltransferase [Rhodospirillales bacterium]|nr:class I SAM-dependent methyltransferase [Rhodospirillales bacterium]